MPPLPAVVAEAGPAHPGPVPQHGLPVPAVPHLARGRGRTADRPAREVHRERGGGSQRGAEAALAEQGTHQSDNHHKFITVKSIQSVDLFPEVVIIIHVFLFCFQNLCWTQLQRGDNHFCVDSVCESKCVD